MKKYKLFIGGQWRDSQNGDFFETVDPFRNEPWALIPRSDSHDADAAVEAAYNALHHGDWAQLNATGRGKLLRRLAALIRENADRIARTEVRDNGKLLSEMAMQLGYIPEWYDYYGGLADKVEGTVIPIDKSEIFNFTRYEPVGVVALITPWNSPLMILAYKLAPALAAGCTVVIKPSEFTSASALEFAELIEQAGFPKGVVNVITGFGSEVGGPLVKHPKVAKVAFTGSEITGQRIYEQAASGLKKVTLELGGKSANIIFADAEIDNAVNGAVAGIFAAAGQTCIAGSRLLVQRSVHDEVVDRVVKLAGSARMGDPLSDHTQVGPIANEPQFDKILSYMDVAAGDGAELALGGKRARRDECGSGLFIEPTIYTGVNNDMRIAREEVFGPVLSVIPFETEEDAVRIANDTNYGLAAGVWSTDYRRIIRIPNLLQAGTVWINTYRSISYMSPFGGYKRSGLGRENGQDAIYNYLQTKSVWISNATSVPNPFVMR